MEATIPVSVMNSQNPSIVSSTPLRVSPAMTIKGLMHFIVRNTSVINEHVKHIDKQQHAVEHGFLVLLSLTRKRGSFLVGVGKEGGVVLVKASSGYALRDIGVVNRVYVLTRRPRMRKTKYLTTAWGMQTTEWIVPPTSSHATPNAWLLTKYDCLQQHRAATTIQSAWRGKMARALAEHLTYAPDGPGYHRARGEWGLLV